MRPLASLACLTLLVGRAASENSPDEIVLCVAGDIAYPDGWGGIDEVDAHGRYLFALVQPILERADLNFANLECPLTAAATVVAKTYPIRCKPERLQYLLQAGFNLFSLANNHALDAGMTGILDTLDRFREAAAKQPLWWAGTGRDADDAGQPVQFTPPGKRASISFFAVSNTSPDSPVASLHDPTLITRIAKASSQTAITIVSVHNGPEYHHVPTAAMVQMYRAWVDAGADLVVGHHAHVIQGVERYRDGLILYNLGNFSFGSRTRRHLKTGARLYSAIGRITFSRGQIRRAELIPLYVNNTTPWTLESETLEPRHAMPQLLAGSFARFMLDELDDFTAQMPGAQPTRLMRVGDRSFVDLGTGPLDPKSQTAALYQQAEEYRAVTAAGATPRRATASEMLIENRAGTPVPAADAAMIPARSPTGRRCISEPGRDSGSPCGAPR